MRMVEPYRTAAEAREALDNGGRFYHLLSRRDDARVSAGELARAAGLHLAQTEAFLFLDLALAELPDREREEVVALLEPGVRARYERGRAARVGPGELDACGPAGRAVVLEATLRQVDERVADQGLVLIPVTTGQVMVMVPVPVRERFRLYEAAAAPGGEPSRRWVAVPADGPDLGGKTVRIGGELKEMKFDPASTDRDADLFLDAVFFTPR